MNKILTDFIGKYYIENLSICDTIIEWFHSGEAEYKPGTTTGGYRPELKDSNDIWIPTGTHYHWIPDYLYQLRGAMEKYAEDYPACKWYGNSGIEEGFRLQWYRPGGGFKNWHTERCSHKGDLSTRHLVFMTYLNDVTDKGETEFMHQKMAVQPRKGLTVIWPADWTHTHRGVPSPSQDKYIATGWYNLKGKLGS
jgi:hypothetical protein